MTRKEQEQQQKREEASKAASQRERQTGPLELPVVVPKGPVISKKALLARKEAREKAEAAAAAAVTEAEKVSEHTQQKEPNKGKSKGKRRYEDFDACMDLNAPSEEPSEEILEGSADSAKAAEGAAREHHPKTSTQIAKHQDLDRGKGKDRSRGGPRGTASYWWTRSTWNRF